MALPLFSLPQCPLAWTLGQRQGKWEGGRAWLACEGTGQLWWADWTTERACLGPQGTHLLSGVRRVALPALP